MSAAKVALPPKHERKAHKQPFDFFGFISRLNELRADRGKTDHCERPCVKALVKCRKTEMVGHVPSNDDNDAGERKQQKRGAQAV